MGEMPDRLLERTINGRYRLNCASSFDSSDLLPPKLFGLYFYAIRFSPLSLFH